MKKLAILAVVAFAAGIFACKPATEQAKPGVAPVTPPPVAAPAVPAPTTPPPAPEAPAAQPQGK